MLRPGENSFTWDIETHFCSGNRLWSNPEEAKEIGRQVGYVLLDRHEGNPAKTLGSAIELVDYKALPAERRTALIHGVVDAIAEVNGFGGIPEWDTARTEGVSV